MIEEKWILVDENLKPIDNWEDLPDDIGGAHSYLIEYYKECRRCNVIIGRELKTTLERLIQDIFGDCYRFDLKKPHNRINFIEKEIKHFESPFAGEPFILTLWQKAFIEALFGFQTFAEGSSGYAWRRRFIKTFLLIARKNGKTPFTGAISLSEWFCGEPGQKIMCASNDYEEAGLVFDAINNFREESKAMRKVTRKTVKGIFFGNPKQKKKTGKHSAQNKGTIKKMSAKSSAKEGRNLKTVIVDEVHEMKDASTVLPLESSISTQDEPLFFEITTEGIVRDGYLDARLEELRKTLRGEDEDERTLIWLFTQDSEEEVWNDPESWVKSNPMLGVCKKRSYLSDLVEAARKSGSKRGFTLAKEFNIKELGNDAWLNESDIVACDGKFTLEDFRGWYAVVGVDLAETNDLCACTFLFIKPNDETKYVFTMYFVTEKKATEKGSTESPTNTEKKDYYTWSKEGWCRIVSGNVIDDDVVAEYIYEIYNEFSIIPVRIGYDEWHAKEFAKICKQHFGPDRLTKIRMTYDVLNAPMITLERDIAAHKVNYNCNPMCRWNFRNTAVKHDKNGLVMPEKIGGYVGNKIDGTMSKIICYATLRECKKQYMDLIGR